MVKLPSRLEELLPLSAFERVMDSLHRPELSQKVRESIAKVGNWKDVNPLEQVQDAWKQARSWLTSIAGDQTLGSSQVINATGSLFLSEESSVPTISSISLSQARWSAGFQDRDRVRWRSAEVVGQTIGAKHHAWFSEPASALQLVVKAVGPKGTLLARSDSVRIPGFGDVRSILSLSGADLTEIGATNGATKQEWNDALADASGKVVVTVSPNSLSCERAATSRAELVEVAHSHNVPIVEVLVDGTPDRKLHEQYDFPLLSERIQRADSIVLLPTHFLLGGVRGMLCIGPEPHLSKTLHQASLLGCELDSASVTANLLALQVATLEDDLERGFLGSLMTNPENLRNRSERLAIQIKGIGPISEAVVIEHQQPLGPSPWDRYSLTGPAIRLRTAHDFNALVEQLRTGSEESPSIKLESQGEELLIHLRFVHPDDDHKIAEAIAR